jgi:hypothetical protein
MIDVSKIQQVTLDRHDSQAIYRWARSVDLVCFTNLANVPKGALGLAAQSIFKPEMGVGLLPGGKMGSKLIEQMPMTWYTFHAGAKRVAKTGFVYEFPKGTCSCDRSLGTDPAGWGIAMAVAFALPS